MIVLHALWEDDGNGALHIFGETSVITNKIKPRRGRPSNKRTLKLHPFVLSHESLSEAVGQLFGSEITAQASHSQLHLTLPSSAFAPLHSPQLISDEIVNDSTKTLSIPWVVNTLVFEPGLVLDILLSIPHTIPQGIILGDTLRFWSEAAKFGLELLIKQCFIPTIKIVKDNGSMVYLSRWETVLEHNNQERFQVLTRVIPPICHIALQNDSKQLPPQDLLMSFLNHTIDGFIRYNYTTKQLIFRKSQTKHKKRKENSIPESWIFALFSDDPKITTSNNEKSWKLFIDQIQDWLLQIQAVNHNAPFRTCFKLEPQEDSDGPVKNWYLSYYLQAVDDPSLLVPARTVWEEGSDTLMYLNRRFNNPQEQFLTDLGRASVMFPNIEKSLKFAHPDRLELDTTEAHEFLRNHAPLLDQSGFGVLLPQWWQKPTARLGVKLKLKSENKEKVSSGLLGLNSILAYDWQLAIGDETLSQKEFEQLVRLKAPIIKLRGQYIELKPGEVKAALAFFKKHKSDREISLRDALRLGLGLGNSETGLPIVDLTGEGEIEKFLNRLTGDLKLQHVPVPRTFQGQLRDYQKMGLAWFMFLKQFGLGACLADDMGLGKTIQLIALLLNEQCPNENKKSRIRKAPTLIISPMSVLGNWCKELERFAPSLNILVHHGSTRNSGKRFLKIVKNNDIVVTTYALASRDEKLLSKVDWENVVLDEAQNIKNQTTKQSQAIKRLEAKFKVALTGTPVENRLSELWSIMEFLNPGYLGSVKDFHKNYAIPIEKFHNPKSKETLKRLVQPLILRRLKTDKSIINDLPDKNEMKVYCTLTKEQATLYEAVVEEIMEKIQEAVGMRRRGLIGAGLIKLKQICNHPAQFLHDGSKLPGRSGKLERLVEMLKEALAEGDKALIFTQFAEFGNMLKPYLQNELACEVQFLQGSSTKKQRDMMIASFQDDRHGPPIFIISLKAGGLGLNLTAANRVFHFDRWWNPAVENQATDRAYRIGQKRNVLVHKFVCLGTLEERIDQMIEQKQELAENIVGSSEKWITELSTDQLRKVIALSRDSFGGD